MTRTIDDLLTENAALSARVAELGALAFRLTTERNRAEEWRDHDKARAERAEAALATARDDALEEAAQRHDGQASEQRVLAEKYRGGSNPWFSHIQKADAHEKSAREIRALKGGAE